MTLNTNLLGRQPLSAMLESVVCVAISIAVASRPKATMQRICFTASKKLDLNKHSDNPQQGKLQVLVLADGALVGHVFCNK